MWQASLCVCDLCVGKSTAAEECVYLFYKEKGVGGLGVSGTPHVINFDKSSITLYKKTQILSKLELSAGLSAVSWFDILNPNMKTNDVNRISIGKSATDYCSAYFGYQEPGIGYLGLFKDAIIIDYTTEKITLHKPTKIVGNLEVSGKINNYYTSTECDNKFASTAWVNEKVGSITPPETISNSMLIIQRNEWMDYFYEPEQVPEGYEYQGCKTDWFPIIDYNASTMTDMLTQFKLDNTHTHQKYTNGTSGWLLRVKFIIVHVPYSTAHLTTSPAACFQPGNKGIDEMGLPFKYWLKSNISSYLWDTKHCTYSDGGKLTSNPCTVEFEYNGTETSMDIMMSGRASSTRGFQHDTFEMCFNIPTDQLNMIRIAMGWWYNGNGRTNYTCPPIRYYFKRNT